MAEKPKSISHEVNLETHPECRHRPTTRKTVMALLEMEEKELKGKKGFMLDAIVVRLDVPNKTITETTKFVVDGNFHGNEFSVTPSRINVLDFVPGRSLEFVANPKELREELTKQPLALKLSDELDVIGYSVVEFTPDFLSSLEAASQEILFSFEAELKKCDGTRTGSMQMMVRLQPKCDEYQEDDSPDGKCRNANKEINPNDILFVVAEEKPLCVCSQIGVIPADSEQDLRPTCLDLSNFRAVNANTIPDTDILECVDPAQQQLKSIRDQYQQLLGAVNIKKCIDLDDENELAENRDIFSKIPSDSCSTESSDVRIAAAVQPDKAFLPPNLPLPRMASQPELIKNEPVSFRCCPVCKTNMEFLPKLAACPNCCYKPLPYFQEKAYDISQNADDVLKGFCDKVQTKTDSFMDTNSQDSMKNRCTCGTDSNKECSYCRIKKLCEMMFQHNSQDSEDNCGKKSSSIHCVSSSDNRPFLTKIFSELKDLYDIEQPKKKKLEKDERCEKELNKSSGKESVNKNTPMKREAISNGSKGLPIGANEARKRHKCKTRKKRSLKPASESAVRSRLYDYQLANQNLPPKIGHKTCINGFAGRKNVPSHMGWLWNIHNRGNWKPGAIRKPIKELMQYFLKDFPADTILVSQYNYRKMCKSNNEEDSPVKLVQKPTLHIHKKDGSYIITMRPLKNRELLNVTADPYEEMKPIQFRIVKNPRLMELRELKDYLKALGFKKCTCHKPIAFCFCRSFVEKKKLEYHCNKECRRRKIEPCCDKIVLSDTTDSEPEFDFGVTPPVGVIKPERLLKINLVNSGTQYQESDWNKVPLFPRPPNKYMKMYQCAMAKRPPAKVGKMTPQQQEQQAKLDPYNCEARERAMRKAAGAGAGAGKGALKSFPVRGLASKGPKEKEKKKLNMLKYIMKMDRRMKMTPAEMAAKRREKMKLLSGANPPLLCKIDRLGKAVDPCAPCYPCCDNRIC